MVHRFRNVVVVAAAVAWLSAPAGAQQPQQRPEHDHDAHHRDMLTRGTQAMGFDQERTVHHFRLYEDGGAIDVAVKEAGGQVPGTADMTRLRDRITYRYEETPAGGRVRIVTRDAAALAAVHAFLQFQIEDHRTGDSGVVERLASGTKVQTDLHTEAVQS